MQQPQSAQIAEKITDLRFAPGTDLDRRRRSSWIAVAGLAVLVALVAACSGAQDDGESSTSALASTARWVPSDSALLVGEKVRLTYDDAPEWTGTKACSGKLRPGGKVVGELLMDKYAAIASVGGYSCRRNTADTKRMSVHGTGRALDVMIPVVSGQPNRKQGDKIANWLILNAQQIGVQLIIWNRTIWRSNGTNDAKYGGPIPHIDHLHVELTEEAAAHSTKWFTTTDGDDDAGDPDSSTATTDTDSGTDTTDTDSGTETDDDAATEPEPDAAPPPAKDSGVTPPPSTPDASATTPPDTTTPPESNPADGVDSAGDAPGESNSIPSRPTRKTPTVADDEPPPDLSGCSTAPGSHPLSLGSGLGVLLGLAAWLRRKRRN